MNRRMHRGATPSPDRAGAAAKEGRQAFWPPPVGLLLLWACLWLNLNTGPWLVRGGLSSVDALTVGRVYAPFGVLVVGALWVMLSRARRRRLRRSPLALLGLYGLLGMAAGMAWSPGLEYALYWSVAYLAAVAVCVAACTGRKTRSKATVLLVATWGATAVVAAGVTAKGSSSIFGDAPTAYFVIDELGGASRSSGVGRWAGVTALVAIVWALHQRHWIAQVVLLAGAGVGLYVVYRVQSRGAVFAAVAGLLFLLCLDKRRRRWGLPLLATAIVLTLALDTGSSGRQRIWRPTSTSGKGKRLRLPRSYTVVLASIWCIRLPM
jgi:hypothetical protein